MSKLGLIIALPGSVQAFGHSDFSGEWTRVPDEDTPLNSNLGDGVGLSLNASALRGAETWEASRGTLPEWQCRANGGASFKREPAAVMIPAGRSGTLKDVTAPMRPGYLRNGGMPVVEDPRYLAMPFAGSMQFRRDPDGPEWTSLPCLAR